MFPGLKGTISRAYHFITLILEHIKKKKNHRKGNKFKKARVSKQTAISFSVKCKCYQAYIKLMLHDITIPKNTWLITD